MNSVISRGGTMLFVSFCRFYPLSALSFKTASLFRYACRLHYIKKLQRHEARWSCKTFLGDAYSSTLASKEEAGSPAEL